MTAKELGNLPAFPQEKAMETPKERKGMTIKQYYVAQMLPAVFQTSENANYHIAGDIEEDRVERLKAINHIADLQLELEAK